jgi:hypothetical protein
MNDSNIHSLYNEAERNEILNVLKEKVKLCKLYIFIKYNYIIYLNLNYFFIVSITKSMIQMLI